MFLVWQLFALLEYFRVEIGGQHHHNVMDSIYTLCLILGCPKSHCISVGIAPERREDVVNVCKLLTWSEI